SPNAGAAGGVRAAGRARPGRAAGGLRRAARERRGGDRGGARPRRPRRPGDGRGRGAVRPLSRSAAPRARRRRDLGAPGPHRPLPRPHPALLPQPARGDPRGPRHGRPRARSLLRSRRRGHAVLAGTTRMSRSRRRLLLLLAAVPALLYQAGMAALEGQRRGFWDSVLWAASTLTTTGYGLDHQWRHPAMVVYVTVVQFLGLFMVYLIFPIFFIPFLEERFEVRLPQESPRDMAHHVVIYRHGPAVETLISELNGARVPMLVLEPDEAG